MVFWRAIDANLARCGEGLRVLEDIFRFEIPNKDITSACKSCRNMLKDFSQQVSRLNMVNARSTGTDFRAKDVVPERFDIQGIITANVRRCTEACRVIEECSSLKDVTNLRYAIYDLEQMIWSFLSRKLKGPGIYVVSDDPDHLIKCAKESFVPIVQFRNKVAPKSEIYDVCKRLAKDLMAVDVKFIVNDYVDIAIAVSADGVHVGQDEIPIPIIRDQFGHSKIIGRTTHSLEQGLAAQEDGVDYVSVGPIWKTPSKPDRDAIGFDYLKKSDQLTIPFVAIGGINLDNIDQVTPFKPPLVGAIRSTTKIHELWAKIQG